MKKGKWQYEIWRVSFDKKRKEVWELDTIDDSLDMATYFADTIYTQEKGKIDVVVIRVPKLVTTEVYRITRKKTPA